jgi:hypothetical protein
MGLQEEGKAEKGQHTAQIAGRVEKIGIRGKRIVTQGKPSLQQRSRRGQEDEARPDATTEPPQQAEGGLPGLEAGWSEFQRSGQAEYAEYEKGSVERQGPSLCQSSQEMGPEIPGQQSGLKKDETGHPDPGATSEGWQSSGSDEGLHQKEQKSPEKRADDV